MQLIRPQWQADPRIQVAVTTRIGGVSLPPYDGLNVGDHVGDDPAAVASNRAQLLNGLGIQHAQWLTQVHGVDCVKAQADGVVREADACWSDETSLACIVMTADCLPVVFSDGQRVAAAHAGWRGLVNGVLEQTLAVFEHPPAVWLGPAIGPQCFEVGNEVREEFCDHDAQAAIAFVPSTAQGKWLADLYQLARLRLQRAGVTQIAGGGFCTFTDSQRFYSYRRAPVTGRLATLIWKTA